MGSAAVQRRPQGYVGAARSTAVNGRAAVGGTFALLCGIWGSTWLAIKFGVEAVPTFLAASLRFVLAAGVLLLLAAVLRRKIPRTRGAWAAILFVGVVLFVGDYGLIYWAEASGVASGLTAVLFATMPLQTALAAHVLLRDEPFTLQKILGTVVGFAGVVLIFRGEIGAAGAGLFFPLLAIVVAASCGGLGTVAMKGWARDIDSFVFNGFAMATGAAGLAAISLATGEPWAIPSWPAGLAPILYLGLVGSVVAFVAYHWLLHRVDATTASYVTLITPIVALFLGFAFANEVPDPADALGTAVTLVGIYLASSRRVTGWTRTALARSMPSESRSDDPK